MDGLDVLMHNVLTDGMRKTQYSLYVASEQFYLSVYRLSAVLTGEALVNGFLSTVLMKVGVAVP